MTTRLLIDRRIGETRAVVVDDADAALSLYINRDDTLISSVQWGDVVSGYVRDIEPSAGAVFIELSNGEDVVWQLRTPERARSLSVGSEHLFQVKSEARADKRAVVTQVGEDEPDPPSPLERWRAACPALTPATPLDDGPEAAAQIDEIFSDVLVPQLVLPRGGRLTLEPTRALVSIDVDTAGRTGKGSPRARALSLNRDAAMCAARQLELRRLGGLAVVDCIGPIDAKAGEKVRDAFRTSWSDATNRKADVLYPSRLGLMEISLAWRYTPLAELFHATMTHRLTNAGLALVHQLERTARANPSRHVIANASPELHQWLSNTKLPWQSELTNRVGPRFTLTVSEHLNPETFEVKEDR